MAQNRETSRAVWVLAVTQTIGYASLYYIFAALVSQWSADLGWTNPQLALGPTIAIVISGALAPLMGRLIDLGRSRLLLTGGSIIGGLALIILAQAETRVLYLLAWSVLGVAQAAALYEVCFALLIRRMGPEARAAIIKVTLVAGFASTISFPAAAALSDAFGWRAAVWCAAIVVIFVQTPLNFYAVTKLRKGELAESTAEKQRDKSALRQALKSQRFWILGLVLAALSLNHWMIIAFIIPLFMDLGATPKMAIFAASIVGPAQVVGRLVLMRFDKVAENSLVLTLCIAGMFAGVFCLAVAGAAAELVVLYAIAQGAAIGVMTILRPVLIADVMGKAGYGAVAGSIQVLPLLAGAAAPLLGGVLFELGGATAMITASMLILILGALGAFWLRRLLD